jgi:hypothetical protein
MNVSAGKVDGALGGTDDNAIGASHTGSKVLSNSAATVAETELVGADANNSTIVGARSAVAINRSDGSGGVVAILGRDRSSSGSGLGLGRRTWGSSSGSGCGSRGSTRGEDTAWVGRLGSIAIRRSAGNSRLALNWRLAGLGLSRSARFRRSDLTASSTELVLLGAASTSEGVSERGSVALNERLARVGVDEVLILGSAALSGWEVGNEHVGKLRESCRSAGGCGLSTSTADLDGSAVHVELTVADLVDPSPCEAVLAIGDVGRHCDRKCSCATAAGILREVASDVGRAATNDAVNNLPLCLLSGCGVSAQRELA